MIAKIRTALEVIGILVCAVLLWMVTQKPKAWPVNQPTAAQAAPEVADIPKVAITPPKVKVYAPEAKDKVALPPAVQGDPAISVLESSKLPESEHPQTVTTVLNSATGDTSTYVTTDPYPWIASEYRREVGAGYGLKNGQKAGHFFANVELVQIKAAHIGGGLHWFTDGTNMIEATVTGRF